ncbi:alanine--tRNA ligase [Rhodohalobacter sulfatireducens]|uniref:Alanine--tRNA ligase n=1 Tax=Rhodohalobacter sulfatireducens TaxID=2911366 RepID=A0ABS9KH63_9BACT|nr:alanine--tRNA ligase [Rhodohalobacter sulfatireducens]MCG2590201.1 alanine--tRNA ligase [Rhodohalobacter sulfatireducens]
MSTKSSTEIRNEFFEFFKEKEHLIVNSAPVVPNDDPTLLFTNAGMNQFKSIFLDEEKGLEEKGKLWKRAANTQRCIRVSGKHNDLEEVGHDTYHHTLFEMLGNWSFGDYFKEEAIEWAWELLVDRWGMEPDRLYATVFGGDEEDGLPVDDESIELWKSKTSIDPSHILKFGKKDNFWEMGETGPCGPCSEVHIDLRPDEERKKKPGAEIVNMDDPRVMEIWNLVFIQFNRQQDSSLEKLPAQHVDTGMGFERLCAVLQGKRSNYDTDIFTPILDKISELSGKKYGDDEEVDIAMRVIADHIRAVSFSIADGASPSNEGRGYVVRRILRRAVRYGWDRLGFDATFMGKLVPVLAKEFENVFPELHAQQEYVQNVVVAEERSFLNTLGQGIQLFNEMIEGTDTLSGEDAFKLHDTYGFPIDLTQLMAREKGIDVDEEGFTRLMDEQKKRARAAGKFSSNNGDVNNWHTLKDFDKDSVFVGYDSLETEVELLADKREGDRVALLLDRTPFYAESGGQIADTGILKKDGLEIKVLDVQKSSGQYIHYVDHLPEDVSGTWTAIVDADRRKETEKHHTATHLMHAALRQKLGKHVAQKGSLVEPNRLRFDFSHFEAVTKDELNEIEERINQKIQENIPLKEERTVPIDEAKQRGAMMLFGEKYGEEVRVITFDPDYSVELCGGTHVDATGRIGYFRFTNETSVAAGIRRVEAVVGRSADKLLREEHSLVESLKGLLGDQTDPKKSIQELLEEKKHLEKELKKLQHQKAAGRLDEILEDGEDVNGIKLFTGKLDGGSMDRLKQSGYDALNKQEKESVIVLATVNEEENKVYLLAAITEDLVSKGMKAGDLVSVLGRTVGGGGGGQPNLATAGGRFPEKISDAFQAAKEWIEGQNL